MVVAVQNAVNRGVLGFKLMLLDAHAHGDLHRPLHSHRVPHEAVDPEEACFRHHRIELRSCHCHLATDVLQAGMSTLD